MTGGVRRSKCSTQLFVRALPEVTAERAGRKMRATASDGKTDPPNVGVGRLLLMAAMRRASVPPS